jgi:hypothetical protein
MTGALAGNAVLIAPVSSGFPCKQGILQRNLQFWRLGDAVVRQKNPYCSVL